MQEECLLLDVACEFVDTLGLVLAILLLILGGSSLVCARKISQIYLRNLSKHPPAEELVVCPFVLILDSLVWIAV